MTVMRSSGANGLPQGSDLGRDRRFWADMLIPISSAETIKARKVVEDRTYAFSKTTVMGG